MKVVWGAGGRGNHGIAIRVTPRGDFPIQLGVVRRRRSGGSKPFFAGSGAGLDLNDVAELREALAEAAVQIERMLDEGTG